MISRTSDVAVCCCSDSANSSLRAAISFFRSTSASARLGFVGALLLVGDLRTACPRFAILGALRPGKIAIASKLSAPNYPIRRLPYRTIKRFRLPFLAPTGPTRADLMMTVARGHPEVAVRGRQDRF